MSANDGKIKLDLHVTLPSRQDRITLRLKNRSKIINRRLCNRLWIDWSRLGIIDLTESIIRLTDDLMFERQGVIMRTDIGSANEIIPAQAPPKFTLDELLNTSSSDAFDLDEEYRRWLNDELIERHV